MCYLLCSCRERDEEDSDKVDLVMAFSALEEKVLEQYTFAKVAAYISINVKSFVTHINRLAFCS